jgi:hypothetical protein
VAFSTITSIFCCTLSRSLCRIDMNIICHCVRNHGNSSQVISGKPIQSETMTDGHMCGDSKDLLCPALANRRFRFPLANSCVAIRARVGLRCFVSAG